MVDFSRASSKNLRDEGHGEIVKCLEKLNDVRPLYSKINLFKSARIPDIDEIPIFLRVSKGLQGFLRKNSLVFIMAPRWKLSPAFQCSRSELWLSELIMFFVFG